MTLVSQPVKGLLASIPPTHILLRDEQYFKKATSYGTETPAVDYAMGNDMKDNTAVRHSYQVNPAVEDQNIEIVHRKSQTKIIDNQSKPFKFR